MRDQGIKTEEEINKTWIHIQQIELDRIWFYIQQIEIDGI